MDSKNIIKEITNLISLSDLEIINESLSNEIIDSFCTHPYSSEIKDVEYTFNFVKKLYDFLENHHFWYQYHDELRKKNKARLPTINHINNDVKNLYLAIGEVIKTFQSLSPPTLSLLNNLELFDFRYFRIKPAFEQTNTKGEKQSYYFEQYLLELHQVLSYAFDENLKSEYIPKNSYIKKNDGGRPTKLYKPILIEGLYEIFTTYSNSTNENVLVKNFIIDSTRIFKLNLESIENVTTFTKDIERFLRSRNIK